MPRRSLIVLVIGMFILSACGAVLTPAASPTPPAAQPAASAQADLTGLKQYLLMKATALRDHTAGLQRAAGQYYDLAKSTDFDYKALWETHRAEVRTILLEARKEYLAANPAYETMEGIVGGVPVLAQFDVDIDAGSAASEDPSSAVSFDVALPDGRTLEKPGNFFYLAEATLWGTNAAWVVQDIQADLDGDGTVAFGEVLPDAVVLKGIADGFAAMSADLLSSAEAWQPTVSDAFTALVVMTPTMDELFGAWRDSRSVSGKNASSQQFVATSRLQDIVDIISSLQVIYQTVEPMIAQADAAQAQQARTALANLHSFVDEIRQKEAAGKRYTPEEADLLGSEAQNRATAITGQISQLAAMLQVPIAEQ